MQELPDQLGPLAGTADDKFDPARAIQQLRRILYEVDALGDKLVPTRKTHAFQKALPDNHYGSFRTVLVCKKPRDESAALDFDDVANQATTYHAMDVCYKVFTDDDCSGSHGRARNTVVHGGTREFRRQGGRVQERCRRRNIGRISNGNNSSLKSSNSNGGINSNSNSHGGSSAGSVQGVRGRGRGNQSAGRGRGRSQDTGRNHGLHCKDCHNSTDHGWNCPLRVSHEAEGAKEQANVVKESAAWFTRVQVDNNELEHFAIVIGDDTQVQKDVPAAAQPCLLYTSPSPRDKRQSRMPSSA